MITHFLPCDNTVFPVNPPFVIMVLERCWTMFMLSANADEALEAMGAGEAPRFPRLESVWLHQTELWVGREWVAERGGERMYKCGSNYTDSRGTDITGI